MAKLTDPPIIVNFDEPQCDGSIVKGKIQISAELDCYLAMPCRQDAEEVDSRDADTPDNWIKRHKDMVRLTGRHPFNSEPKLAALQAAGWVTPPSLSVVRNHGQVPRIDFDSHRLKVSGVPSGELELSMADLMSGKFGPQVSIPVTHICAGNRRKEQNMTKKTIGFNWGCAAVANTVWTGVRICDILAALGITRVSKEHRYLHFEGPEGELPQGDRGVYGTSIDIGWALDRERDVLLAFKQNGELLTPDHGAPLRTLLPGCIGGRMIKWLHKMWVSSEPSVSHYHFFDNRVLPPHVDAELATKEGWWYKEEYIINHMNMNSAMFEPRHNSYFKLEGPNAAKTIKVCGYAYVGGGLKIIRAEISLDGGMTWELTHLTRPEDEIAAARGTDKHWCWSWWETEVDAHKLKDCMEICCRAVDQNQNMQPTFLTWNVMGMMNNCIFRVKVHSLEDGSGVWFEHPTMPGNQPGGWMTEDAGKFDPATATECAPGPNGEAPNRPVAATWDYGEPSNAKHRPRRSARARREQQLRSDSRMITRLVAGLYSVDTHRGNKLSKIGKVLSEALSGPTSHASSSAEGIKPSTGMPVCRHFLVNKCTFGSNCRFSHAGHTDESSHYQDDQHSSKQDWHDYYFGRYTHEDIRRDELLEQQIAVNMEPTATDQQGADSIELTSIEPTSMEPTVSDKYGADSIEPTSMEPTSMEPTVSDRYGPNNNIEPIASEKYGADSIEPTSIDPISCVPTVSDKHGANNHIEPTVSGHCSNTVDDDNGPDSTLDHPNPAVANAGPISNIFDEGISPASTSGPQSSNIAAPCRYIIRSRKSRIDKVVGNDRFATVIGKRLRSKKAWQPESSEMILRDKVALDSLIADKSRRVTGKSPAIAWTTNIDAAIRREVNSYVQTHDLAAITLKQLRLDIEANLGLSPDDLYHKSEYFKKLVVEILNDPKRNTLS